MTTGDESKKPIARAESEDETDTAKASSSSKILSLMMSIEVHCKVLGLANMMSNTPPM